MRTIVVFERDERHTENGQPQLDFRLERMSLPSGSSPLWIGTVPTEENCPLISAQEFSDEAILAYARKVQGLA